MGGRMRPMTDCSREINQAGNSKSIENGEGSQHQRPAMAQQDRARIVMIGLELWAANIAK